jgi:glyoxylase-like metal-dependent hydrolase (beta-lactamase superfamily II)
MLTSNERTFFTNAYIIETKIGLVVVDTMMINSDAKVLRQYIDNINKPLIAVIITHGHPDHYWPL